MLRQKTYQARQAGSHIHETKGPNTPQWFIVDAADHVVGRLSTVLAKVIMGKHKPTFTRHADAGDFVIVMNADKIQFTRTKWDKKLYRAHTGYISGLKTRTAREMLAREPEEILRQAVFGMTTKSALARRQMKKLKLYTSKTTVHPHSAQNPKPLPMGTIRHTVLAKPPIKKAK
jgi:large subunit ribosomal protein L13